MRTANRLIIVGSEGTGRQSCYVYQVGCCVAGKRVSDGYGVGDFVRRHNDLVAFDSRLSRLKVPILAGYLKMARCLSVDGGQTTVCKIEAESRFSIFYHQFVELWPRIGNVLTVVVCQGPKSQASSNFLFIFWMDVGKVSDVHSDSHSGLWDGESLELCFTKKSGVSIFIIERRNLGEVE